MLNKKIDRLAFEQSGQSKVRVNREYMLRKSVAEDFNTYLSFEPFRMFADVISEQERVKSYKDETYDPEVGVPGVRSIFNKYGGVMTGGDDSYADSMLNNYNNGILKASEIRISNNVPLIDTRDNRKRIRENSGCTIRELVQASESGALGRATYSYSDFMYCKHLGKMPNSYLVTLRRFPTAVDDYISSAGEGSTRTQKEISSTNPNAIGQLVTWMNTPGNNLNEILSYSVEMPYEERQAKWESAGNDADASSKPLNAISAVFDKTYRQQYSSGYAGAAVNDSKYMGQFFSLGGALKNNDAPYHGLLGQRDQNKVYGPIDVIKSVYYRGEGGLKFEQNIKLVFDYELRSYNGINGRQAMLDLISNILNVTYSTGTFWGGGYTGGGAHQNNIFANLNIMKASGGFTNFVDAFYKDVDTIKSTVKTNISAQGGILNAIKNFLNDLGGMIAGSFLNSMGRPQKSFANSLLSPAPTGLWHLTIGNPFHPIMSMGNMVLKNTTISHYGPLGIDDFPTGIRVECELTRGKPRDLRGIEMMYMNGNDRIYTSMGKAVFDMYEKAKAYKKSQSPSATKDSSENAGLTSFYDDFEKSDSDSAFAKYKEKFIKTVKTKTTGADGKSIETEETVIDNLSVSGNLGKIIKRYFGTDDSYSIYVPAAEQEYGAFKKGTLKTEEDQSKGTGGVI